MNSYQQSEDKKQSNHNILAHQLKEANLQLKECQAQPFIIDYMHKVIQPNSIYLVFYAILAYFLYILIELFMYNVQNLTTVENQRNHLINLHNYFSIDRESKIDNARIFVDMYRQVFSLNYDNLSSSTPCDQARYFCKQTSNRSLWKTVELGYNTTRKNYQFLIRTTNSKLDGQVFLYNPEWSQSLLIYKLEQYKQFLVADHLLPYLQKQKSVAYYKLTIKKIISEDNYLIKILFCGRLPILHSYARICVVTPGSLQQQVMGKENPIKLVDSTMITVTSSSIQSISLDKVNIVNTFLKEAIYKYIDVLDQQFYMSFPFKECINEYYVKQYYTKNKIKICSPPQILYIMTPLTIFINFNIQISAKYYYEDMVNSGVQNQYSQKLNFLILSNQTFMQNEGVKLENNNLKQSYISILLIVTTVIWVLMMSYLPLKLVGGDLALSVSLMIKLCKAVKQIRNKDDLEQQIDIFNKLNIEINKKDHIFYQTIEYFKYFIWYRKWVFATKNRKKKSILDEGLTLFGSSDFAPVLMYIYKKQIERQTKLVQNYKKMRRIFTQKFMIFQSFDKIEACLHNQKLRIAGQNQKKSGFSKSQIELDQDCVYGRDFCMIQNVENRINKQLQFLQIQKKSKRNVRFSNDCQQEQKPFQYKMSKFVLNLPSQQSIQKNSLKSIEEQIKRKEEKQLQAGSNAVQSSREQRLINQIRDQESQKSQRKEELENWNMFLKFDQIDEQNSFDAQQDQCFELKRYSLKKLEQKVGETYEILFRAYEKMIVINKMYLDKQQVYQIEEYINELYKMQIQKLRYAYKYIKHRNNERQKILKQLSRKLILVKKQKTNLTEIEQEKKQELVGSEKWIQENISIIEDQVYQETKLIDVQFKQFIALEEKYKIDPFLIDKAKICQIKILKVLNYPIPYKKLQNLCDSANEYIRVEARAIMAAQFFNISPHADVQVIEKVQQNLSENQTTHQQKQKTLRLLKQVIENRDNMHDQENEIQLIKNFYNYSHKKFYFIVDLSDNYEVFEPTINEIYKNMGTVDMYQILNLAMNENAQDMIASGNEIKPSKMSDFQIKFKNIHTEANKIKSMGKTGSRKMAYQKDFNRILSKIEQEQIDLSKFIVIILGGQNELQSRTHEDHQSSSAQNRQVYQIIHQQILSKMQKNYFHVILVGYNLKDYQTRQGKLKKYAKHSYSLIEIDLSKLNIEVMHKQLVRMTSHKKKNLQERTHFDKTPNTKELTREINPKIKNQESQQKINKKQLRANRFSLDLKRIKNNLSQVKSEYSIGRKTYYKQRILNQKKSYNFLSKKKPRSYSIDQSFHSLKKQDKYNQESENKTNRPRLINLEDINATFLGQCYHKQVEYNNHCLRGKYSQAFESLAILLNYSIDISSQAWFFKILYAMCQFYQILQVYKLALKLYNEMKEAALLKKNYEYLTISLIGISKCASQAKLQNQSISILKKALEYAWFINSTELQLVVYDQLGEQYYKMGEIDRASIYHKKYSNSITQQKTSPLKTLSKQQLQLQQQKNLSHNYQNLSPLLLAHLNLPITSTEQLPALIPELFTSRSKLSLKTLKAQMETYQIDHQIKRIMKTWLFEVESSQPNIENTKNELNQSVCNNRKFLYLDFKLNYHLKMKGINYSNPRAYLRNLNVKQKVRKKENLQEKIKRFVEDPGLQKQWYQNIVKRVQVDQKRKMSHINDPVRLNKSILTVKNKQQSLKSLFKQIIELSKILRWSRV